ncbi:MAG: integrase arm-type DNA-binding domain-containing protein [Roseiarcus sp.]
MLTDVQIKKLTTPTARREVPDGKITGLYLVLQPSGAKSWALRYRAAGKPAKLTLGPYPALDLANARRRAQEALGEIASGKNPAAEKKAAREAQKAANSTADRVETVAASFIEKYVKRNVSDSWAREAERLLTKEINPKFGFKRLSEVKKSDIHDLLDEIVDRGAPVVANRTLAVFRRLCNWAVERGVVDASPCDKIKAPATEESRDRILSDDEVRLAWGAFERVGWPFGEIAQLLLLTGARRDEIASGRWSEIDLEAKTWTIAKERSKNGVAHEIPLSDAAIAALKALPRISDKKDALIFSTTGRTAVSGFSRAKDAIDKAMADARGAEIETPDGWTFHDLRRTAASGMAGLGIAPHVVEAVLNHKSGTIKGVAAVYNRYSYATEKRAALDAWARRLDAIVTGTAASNVVELAKARG